MKRSRPESNALSAPPSSSLSPPPLPPPPPPPPPDDVEEDPREDVNEDEEDEDEDEEDEMDAEEAEEKELSKMAALIEVLTPEQLSRYEHFRRSHFRRSEVSRIMHAALGSKSTKKPNERMTIAVGGAAKMYAGEIVEVARSVMVERKETGNIQPRHLREAHRRLKRLGKVPKRLNLF